MMTDFPRPSDATAPSALRRKRSDNANPPRAKPPVRRKLRRDMPSQKGSAPPLKNVSIRNPNLLLRHEVQDNAIVRLGQEKVLRNRLEKRLRPGQRRVRASVRYESAGRTPPVIPMGVVRAASADNTQVHLRRQP